MVATTYKWQIEQWHELVNSGVLDGLPIELLEGDIVELNYIYPSLPIYLDKKHVKK